MLVEFCKYYFRFPFLQIIHDFPEIITHPDPTRSGSTNWSYAQKSTSNTSITNNSLKYLSPCNQVQVTGLSML